MATKIEGWEYQNGEWSMYDEISFYRHFVGKEEEPSERPATLVLHDGKHEPVFTASEVRAMLIELRKELEANCRWQNRVEVISASAMRQAFHRPDILSIDPA